ncbi:MAG: hypothetical protein RLZZ24_254 [Pseudomonadota bacterium]|jgi:methionine synthase II (cobalamin-independent)|uniref:hypothetical protein n=1 Tax=Limnohabitans sp. MORI2 TaxID=1751150 RepID=UPI00237788A9|nr:hypothetical protein [Limnohabitans sp. MORI2]BDU59111.1 hypothetical protein LMORI2_20930 [Limnohabitans sp. MORI2]
MDRKDWLFPLLAGLIGVIGTLSGSWVTNYQHERASTRQVQTDLAKQLAGERAAEFKALKEAGLRYMTATDAMVNSLVFSTARDKALAELLTEHLRTVQNAGNDVALTTDDDLARHTMALNQSLARLLMPSSKPMEQRLAELNLQVIDWIKQFKRSLDVLKAQNEEALSRRASVQIAAPLTR